MGAEDADVLEMELQFLQGQRPGSAVFAMGTEAASTRGDKIIKYATAEPDPFEPSYVWANPWLNKKENKGKKEKPKK